MPVEVQRPGNTFAALRQKRDAMKATGGARSALRSGPIPIRSLQQHAGSGGESESDRGSVGPWASGDVAGSEPDVLQRRVRLASDSDSDSSTEEEEEEAEEEEEEEEGHEQDGPRQGPLGAAALQPSAAAPPPPLPARDRGNSDSSSDDEAAEPVGASRQATDRAPPFRPSSAVHPDRNSDSSSSDDDEEAPQRHVLTPRRPGKASQLPQPSPPQQQQQPVPSPAERSLFSGNRRQAVQNKRRASTRRPATAAAQQQQRELQPAPGPTPDSSGALPHSPTHNPRWLLCGGLWGSAADPLHDR